MAALDVPSPHTPTAPGPKCGNCNEPMAVLRLAGHYGRELELDLCAACHLVWFDRIESARLGGPALLALIGAMARAQTLAHRTLRPDAACPRCHGALKTVHNRSRWGRSLQLECLQGHGSWQSFAQFLLEKGLLRAMSSADRAALMQRDGGIACVNCGAALGVADPTCRYCEAVPSLFDVARLARALDPEDALAATTLHTAPATRGALQCQACGAALSGTPLQCGQCGATLAVSRLAEAHAQLLALEPALRAHAERPAPEVVQRRLAALSGDQARHREWVQRMRAGSPQEHAEAEPTDWRRAPWRAVLFALALALAWFGWR